MIQRIQSVWLLLASACAFLSMKFPFFYISANPTTNSDQYNATHNMILLILTSVSGTLCLFTIFVFKQRKLQLWLTILAIVISALNIFLYFNYKKDNPGGGLALTSVFAFLIPIFLILAVRGISKDQKLIKSMDRLR
jgi:glucan phosphoethanolaminetransferase (alkaline phosphatase superfamily)